MSSRALARFGIACLASLPLFAACASSDADSEQSAGRSGPSAPDQRSASPPRGTFPEAGQQPPELDAEETVAGRQNTTSGSATVPYASGRKGDALIVAVRCQGQGKITVSVPSVHVSFPVECLADEAGTTYNQVAVSGVERSGTVAVEAPPPVRWSLTVGRGTPAQEEPPGTR
jgi:hypothetical protein